MVFLVKACRKTSAAVKGATVLVSVAFLLGVALLVAGVVALADTTVAVDAAEAAAYNRAVASWSSASIYTTWMAGTIGDMPFRLWSAAVPVEGLTVGLAPGASTYAEAVVPASVTSLTYKVAGVRSFTVPVAPTVVRYVPMLCTEDICTSAGCPPASSSDGQPPCAWDATPLAPACQCTPLGMAQRCSALSDATGMAVDVPTVACIPGSPCGACRYTVYLAIFAAVANGSRHGTSQDSALQSAFYPFQQASQVYTTATTAPPSTPATFRARLYASHDPFLAAQRLTQGSMRFHAETTPAQGGAGVPLTVVGAVLVAVALGAALPLHAALRLAAWGGPQAAYAAVPEPGSAQALASTAVAASAAGGAANGHPRQGVFSPDAGCVVPRSPVVEPVQMAAFELGDDA